MMQIPLPKARVGDVIVGDVHPNKGYVMFRVLSARYDNGHWYYLAEDKKTEMNEMWVIKIHKQKDLK